MRKLNKNVLLPGFELITLKSQTVFNALDHSAIKTAFMIKVSHL